MKLKKTYALVTIPLVAIALSASKAEAIQYNGNTVYRATEDTTQLAVFSGTAGSTLSINAGQTEKITSKIVDSCGTIRVTANADGTFTGLKIDNVTINTATLPIQTLPSCVGGTLSEARTANFKTPTNQVVIVGKTAGLSVAISNPAINTKNVKINACGFGILKSPPMNFAIGETQYTTANLPDATSAPYLKTINGSPACYTPATWGDGEVRAYKTATSVEFSGLGPEASFGINYATPYRLKKATAGTCNYLEIPKELSTVGAATNYFLFSTFYTIL
jgi:hypothetical protein